jgi:hypothetical protein
MFMTLLVSTSTLSHDQAIQNYLMHYRRRPFHGFHHWLSFAERNNCSTHPIFYGMIERTLNNFRDPKSPNSRTITRDQIEMASRHVDVINIVKRNGSLHLSGEADWFLFMQEFVDVLPDYFHMVINDEDWPVVAPTYSYEELKANSSLPRLTGHTFFYIKEIFSKNRCFQEKHTITRHSFANFMSDIAFEYVTSDLVPIFSHTSLECYADLLIPGYDHFFRAQERDDIHSRSPPPVRLPWEERRSIALWRGRSSGNTVQWKVGDPWWRGQRQRLIEEVQKLKRMNHTLSNRIDVAFTDIDKCDPEICELMKNRYGPTSPYMSKDEQYQYKYIIDVDGNGWTGRFLPSLSEGSLILKARYTTEFSNSFTLPRVHYLPVDTEYGDLVEKVQWAIDHDEEARQITIRAKKLAEAHLRVKDLQCYLSRMVLEYASLLVQPVQS